MSNSDFLLKALLESLDCHSCPEAQVPSQLYAQCKLSKTEWPNPTDVLQMFQVALSSLAELTMSALKGSQFGAVPLDVLFGLDDKRVQQEGHLQFALLMGSLKADP